METSTTAPIPFLRRLAGPARLVLLALTAVAVVALWPAALGGGTTFVAGAGRGDRAGSLVVVRNAGSYRPGADIAYVAPHHGIVFGQVRELNANEYVVAGNSTGTERIPAEDVVGTVVFGIPGAGSVLRAAQRRPEVPTAIPVAILVGAGLLRRRRSVARRAATVAVPAPEEVLPIPAAVEAPVAIECIDDPIHRVVAQLEAFNRVTEVVDLEPGRQMTAPARDG